MDVCKPLDAKLYDFICRLLDTAEMHMQCTRIAWTLHSDLHRLELDSLNSESPGNDRGGFITWRGMLWRASSHGGKCFSTPLGLAFYHPNIHMYSHFASLQ